MSVERFFVYTCNICGEKGSETSYLFPKGMGLKWFREMQGTYHACGKCVEKMAERGIVKDMKGEKSGIIISDIVVPENIEEMQKKLLATVTGM